jgi:hypothetical protein
VGQWDSSRECWSPSPGSTSGTVGLVPGVLRDDSHGVPGLSHGVASPTALGTPMTNFF